MKPGVYLAHAALGSIETLTQNFEPDDVRQLCEVIIQALFDTHGDGLLGVRVDLAHECLIVTFKRLPAALAFADTWPSTLNAFVDEINPPTGSLKTVDENLETLINQSGDITEEEFNNN